MRNELKPVRCGCGGEGKVRPYQTVFGDDIRCLVQCEKCGIATLVKDTATEAIEAWNKAMGANHFRGVTKKVKPERTEPDRKFLEIITEYPKICTYPEYKGKPYYSIKYEENGETIVGFGTYKPEVLSQYLREYFISSAEPERKKGKWSNFCKEEIGKTWNAYRKERESDTSRSN